VGKCFVNHKTAFLKNLFQVSIVISEYISAWTVLISLTIKNGPNRMFGRL
jgi:hypothetical protein